MTSATEVLRRLLDERGVEWASAHEWEGKTFWPDASGINATSTDWGHGLLVHAVLTPEQAIAATLGTETCHIKPWKMERDTGFFDCMECSECGYVTDVSEWAKATYCAGCGRRIEQ